MGIDYSYCKTTGQIRVTLSGELLMSSDWCRFFQALHSDHHLPPIAGIQLDLPPISDDSMAVYLIGIEVFLERLHARFRGRIGIMSPKFCDCGPVAEIATPENSGFARVFQHPTDCKAWLNEAEFCSDQV